jgi:multiple sugar transport system substrate-binding protein
MEKRNGVSRRRLLSAGLRMTGGMALGAALTACAAAPAPPATKPLEATAAATVPPSAVPQEVVELQVWNQDNFGQDTWGKLHAEFEAAHPGLKVSAVLMPFGDIEAKVLTALAAGEPLDVIFVHPMTNNTYALKGALLPLDDYLPDLGIPEDDWYPAFEYHKWRGHVWALPHQDNPTIMGYNPVVFEEEGFTTPSDLFREGEWDIDIYDEYSAKLTKGEGPNKRYGTDRAWSSIRGIQAMYIWGYGGDIWNEDQSETLINSPEAIEAWEHMASYVWNGWAPAPGELQGVSGAAYWERIMMASAARWSIMQAVKADKLPPVRICPWFTFPNGKAWVRDATNAFGIFRRSKHKEEAWKYVKWVTVDGHIMLIKLGWVTPLRKSLMEESYWKEQLDPRWEDPETYKVAAENVRVMVHPPRISEIDKLIQAEWDRILLKQATPKEAMDSIKPKIDEILQETASQPLPA